MKQTNKTFSIEELEKALSHPNIDICKHYLNSFCFITEIYGNQYIINWHRNMSRLTHGDMDVMFFSVKQSATWPNNRKLNLQFYDNNNQIVCVIPIEGPVEYAKTNTPKLNDNIISMEGYIERNKT